MKSSAVTVVNQAGLHARAASKLAALSARFAAELRLGVVSDGNKTKTVDAKSVLSLMMLEAGKGSELQVQADGADEEEALQAVVHLVASGFGESE